MSWAFGSTSGREQGRPTVSGNTACDISDPPHRTLTALTPGTHYSVQKDVFRHDPCLYEDDWLIKLIKLNKSKIKLTKTPKWIVSFHSKWTRNKITSKPVMSSFLNYFIFLLFYSRKNIKHSENIFHILRAIQNVLHGFSSWNLFFILNISIESVTLVHAQLQK